jgi:hypothetical protein
MSCLVQINKTNIFLNLAHDCLYTVIAHKLNTQSIINLKLSCKKFYFLIFGKKNKIFEYISKIKFIKHPLIKYDTIKYVDKPIDHPLIVHEINIFVSEQKNIFNMLVNEIDANNQLKLIDDLFAHIKKNKYMLQFLGEIIISMLIDNTIKLLNDDRTKNIMKKYNDIIPYFYSILEDKYPLKKFEPISSLKLYIYWVVFNDFFKNFFV